MYKFIIERKISEYEYSKTSELTMEEMYAFLAAKNLYLDLRVLDFGFVLLAKRYGTNSVDIYRKNPVAYDLMKKSSYDKVGFVRLIEKHKDPIIEA